MALYATRTEHGASIGNRRVFYESNFHQRRRPNHVLVCDEEGRFRNWKVGFRWPGSEGIAGNALLVCVDKNDDFTDAKVPGILIERNIKFLDLEKTPLPPPAFGCAFIPDLSPESIEAARVGAMLDLLRSREC